MVTRNSENAKKIVGNEVELIQGDATEKGTIEKTLKNVGIVESQKVGREILYINKELIEILKQ